MADEYIRKQEAIDIVAFECGKWTGLAKEISKQLKQLLAADVAPVVRCDDCVYYGSRRKRRETMADEYIRKADAVDAINTNADDLEQNGGIPFAQGARAMAIVVEQMSPADVVPYSISDDGTMTITVPKGMAVGRVFVQRR